jgi:hypothetical protein
VITFELNNQIEPSLIAYKPRFGEQPAQTQETNSQENDTASSSEEVLIEEPGEEVEDEAGEDQGEDVVNQNQ